MKFKFLKATFTSLLLSISCLGSVANAGLIENTINDTFIDKTTGLEWMDFGINDTYSYNQVASLLTTTYSGWALASESQVLTMWHNAFAGKGSEADQVYSTGTYYSRYSNSDANNTELTSIFTTMGYGYDDGKGSLGWFEDDSGDLSYAHFYNDSATNNYAFVYGRDVNFSTYRTDNYSYYSTMLVRVSSVPEPSTLAIFALAMIGLASRRFKKQA